jgi:hypothetical protein
MESFLSGLERVSTKARCGVDHQGRWTELGYCVHLVTLRLIIEA